MHLFLRETEGTIELVIEDNGLGFDLEDAFSIESDRRGLGLTSMKEKQNFQPGLLPSSPLKGRNHYPGVMASATAKGEASAGFGTVEVALWSYQADFLKGTWRRV